MLSILVNQYLDLTLYNKLQSFMFNDMLLILSHDSWKYSTFDQS
jgi:hypothetical protein